MSKVLIEYNTPSKVSRYKRLKVYRDETNVYFDIPEYLEIPHHPDDQYFSVTQKYIDRIDLVSHKFYNESKLWWVIAKANNLTNPNELPLDTILRIPATATLYGAEGIVGNG